jgi:hypothetical protein
MQPVKHCSELTSLAGNERLASGMKKTGNTGF